jgi:Peptidase C10 family
MWLKNGMKRFFEIALITLFLFVLLGNLPYAWAQEQEWHWGLENCTIGACSEGLAGPFFFQYGNQWASYKKVKFEGWESEETLGEAWCFLGSIATIILYHECPRESHFDGVWLSGKNVRIDHEWKYADIKNLVGGIDCWYQDNPETRVIPGCKIDGYCKAADEIRRLFGAITSALRFTSGYGPIFDYPDECIPDMMKDYFGYLSDVIVLPPNGTLNEENKLKLIQSLNNGHPVIVVGNGHAWVLDDYRDDNGDEFHILNFGCKYSLKSHKSYWIRDPVSDGGHYSAKAFIINLRPEPVIVNNMVNFTPAPGPYYVKRFTKDYLPSKCGCPDSSVAFFGFGAWLHNKSEYKLSNLTVKVVTLDNDNSLLLGTGEETYPEDYAGAERGGEGAFWALPYRRGSNYSTGILDKDKQALFVFAICLEKMEPFDFYVDVLGTVR